MVFALISFYSCKTISVVPQATNTVNKVTFDELNLDRKDYIILNTVSAEATLYAHFSSNQIEVDDPDGEFSLSWQWESFGKKEEAIGQWRPSKIKGFVKLGYLSNDYDEELFNIPPYPHWLVRRLAIYRLINAAKIAGADAVIDPVVSTNVEQGQKKDDIIYKTTVSAKLVKIKPDGK
ncbi:MAG: hypothetical protein IJU35_06095 [Paludibacteraceae bacterium]|nr:hypothetical protein [Paludibacteraceae bacterium]